MDAWLPGMADSENYEQYEINERLNNTLWKLYDKFNQHFNIIIDNCEDECLPYNCLLEALTIVNEYINDLCDNETKLVLKKLQMAINSAIKYRTCLFFDF